MLCTRCGRRLRNPVMLGGLAFGTTCAAKMGPAPKAKRVRLFELGGRRAPVVDSRQGDLFGQEVRP